MPTLNNHWYGSEALSWPFGLLASGAVVFWRRWPRSQSALERFLGTNLARGIGPLSRSLPPAYVWAVGSYMQQVYVPAAWVLAPPLLPALRDMMYGECLLYLDPRARYYRDHLLHQVRVALLGDYFLRAPWSADDGVSVDHASSWPSRPSRPSEDLGKGLLLGRVVEILQEQARLGGTPLRKYCKDCRFTESDITPLAVLRAWWTAALFHDIGWPWQRVAELTAELRRGLPGPVALDPAVPAEVEEAFSSELAMLFLRDCPPSPPKGLDLGQKLRLACTFGHAGIGSLAIIAAHHQLAAQTELDRQASLALALAAETVLRHDLERFEKGLGTRRGSATRAPFRDSPLAFLLQLCDGVEHHLRPSLEAVRPRDSLRCDFEFRFPCRSTLLTTPLKSGKSGLRFEFNVSTDHRDRSFHDYLRKVDVPRLRLRFAPGKPADCTGFAPSIEFTVKPAVNPAAKP